MGTSYRCNKNADDIFRLGAENASPTNSKLSSAEDIISQEGAESQDKTVKKQVKKDSLGNELSEAQMEYFKDSLAIQSSRFDDIQFALRTDYILAYARLHTNPSDWIKIKPFQRRALFFGRGDRT